MTPGIAGKISPLGGFPDPNLASSQSESLRLEKPPFHLRYLTGSQIETDSKIGFTPDKSVYTFLFGQVDNWREIKNELSAKGLEFHENSEAGVLPVAFQHWGKSTPERLHGSFIIVVFNTEEQTLFIIRDRCGQKPFYYISGQEFLFATSIKGLKAAGASLQPDPNHFVTWLALRYVPQPFTLYKDVKILPSAHTLTVNRHGNVTITRYWSSCDPRPTSIISGRHPYLDQLEQGLEEVDQLANRAVVKKLNPESQVLALVSGGIDSSLLTYYLHKNNANFRTCSIRFSETTGKGGHSHEPANSFGREHINLELTPKEIDRLPELVSQDETPIGNPLSIALNHLAKHAAESGYHSVFGGDGPDEHFAGYRQQRTFLTAHRLGPLAAPITALGLQITPAAILRLLNELPHEFGSQDKNNLTVYLLKFAHYNLFEQSSGLHQVFNSFQIPSIIHPDLLGKQSLHPILESQPLANQTLLSSALSIQYDYWLPDFALAQSERAMAPHGINYLSPFLDHELIQFAFRLSDKLRIKGAHGKFIWRKLAERHLPEQNFKRPKNYFALPLSSPKWRTSLRKLAAEVLSKDNINKHGWIAPKAAEKLLQAEDTLSLRQLASLTILHLWLEQF